MLFFTNTQHTGENVAYNYDDAGQLQGANYSTQTDETYTYDDNGNRTGGSYATDDNNQLTGDGTFTYTYDDEGNRLTRTRTSGASANDKTTEYTWDYRNRLTEVKFKNNAGTVTKVVSYTYDVFDRLIGNAVDTDGDTDIDHQEAYVYDGNQIVLRFAANTSSGLAANDLKDRYLWGPAVDQLLADEQVTSLASAGTVYWALGDHENSVRDWARYSGGTTTIADHAEYDSFGNRLDSPTMDSVFGWTGRYHDTDTGLQWNGSSAGGGRWYDPKVGRWISEDRIEFGGDLSNIARYGGNSPTNGTDPSGLQATIPGAAANAAAAGWTAKEIATTFGLSLAAAEALVNAQKIADAAEQVIKTITENVRRMKFGDPCTAAKEAVKQAKKGLDSLEKVIKEHEGKIQNPRGNITRWQPGLTEQQYIDVLIKKWQADIERAKFNIEASKKALEVLEAAVTATCGK